MAIRYLNRASFKGLSLLWTPYHAAHLIGFQAHPISPALQPDDEGVSIHAPGVATRSLTHLASVFNPHRRSSICGSIEFSHRLTGLRLRFVTGYANIN